jgi:hypothetical protein
MVRVARQQDKITNLGLSGCGIGPIGAKEIADYIQFTAVLKNLSVANNNIDGEAAQQLAMAALGSSSLEVLSGVPIKELRAGNLTKLDLQGKGLGATEGIVLAELMQLSPVLENLSVANNNIDGEGAQQLARVVLRSASLEVFSEIPIKKLRADALTKLDLKGVGVSGALVLSDLLKFSSALKSCNLHLLKNGLDVESATMISKIGAEKGIMLSGMTRDQTEASFMYQRLQPADGILIGSDLQFIPVLTGLNLMYNRIGDEGAIAIAEALKVNAVLTTLRLFDNNIGPEGAIAIAEALKVNAVLTSLDVGRITEQAALGIVRVARQQDKITNLGLCRCEIGPIGAKEIADYIQFTAVLTELDLSLNEIKKEGAIAIAKALKVNKVLTKLDLAGSEMGDAGEKAVRDAVEDRSGFELVTYLEA